MCYTLIDNRLMWFQSRPKINPCSPYLESPVAQWLEHPTRSWRVEFKSHLGLDFFLSSPCIYYHVKQMISFLENSQMVQPHNSRKELLMKWREEKKLKLKMGALSNTKKKTFIVGQVKFKPPAWFSEKSVTKQTKKENRATEDVPVKRVTRASVKLAQKQKTTRPKSPVRKPPKKSKVQKQVL